MKLKIFFTAKNFETVIHAFVTSRIDYCNLLYFGVCKFSLSHLQLVQNAIARFLTGAKKRDHISPILASLHLLPIEFHIKFKVLLFFYKRLHGQAPEYITDLIFLTKCPIVLLGSNNMILSVPRSRLNLKGDLFRLSPPYCGMTYQFISGHHRKI